MNNILFRTLLCLPALGLLAACAPEERETEAPMRIGYEITVRSLGYDLTLQELRESEDTLWTLSTLTPPAGMAGMALDALRLSVDIEPTDKTVRHIIVGSADWTYEAPEDLIFVTTPEEAPAEFLESNVVWDREDPTLELPFTEPDL
ncbi:MAG: hypothetical protein JJU00_05415 [Opitutales bacterium]|nr:hypothetical protein [Opitutales bacterium]